MLLTWVFGRLGYLFDKSRVPIGLVVLAFVLFEFFVPNNHVYSSKVWTSDDTLTSDAALAARYQKIKGDHASRPVAIVAASGGGVRAALWSGLVLEELGKTIPDFEDQILLLSSVSGGSVGSMYYYNQAYREKLKTERASLAGGSSSLSALIWGLAYPESARLAVGSLLKLDRGWAQEVAWSHHLEDRPTLATLEPAVAVGAYPLHIYNSCFLESGQRFLMSPARILPPTDSATEQDARPLLPRAHDSRTMEMDLELVTAARISATFPYATPQANANVASETDASGSLLPRQYHVADGGYYDNSGLLTAIEVMDQYLEQHQEAESTPQKIALIEIRADAGDFADTYPAQSGGLKMELIGPMSTAVNVVFGSQAARNRQEIRWIGQLWHHRNNQINLQHFVFYLSHGPLSWHLSKREKLHIHDHWRLQESLPQTDSDHKQREAARNWNHKQAVALSKFLNHTEAN